MDYEAYKRCRFRQVREELEYSHENLQNDIENNNIKINFKQISLMELGKRSFPDSVFEAGMKFMNPSYKTDIKYGEESERLLLEYLKAKHYMNNKEVEKIIRKFEKKRDCYLNSCGYYHYILFRVFEEGVKWLRYDKSDELEKNIEILKRAKEVFEPDLVAALYLASSHYQMNITNYEQAIAEKKMAEKFALGNFFCEIKTMLIWREFQISLRTSQIVNALNLYEKLKVAFDLEGNQKRIIFLMNQKSIILMMAHQFKAALELAEEAELRMSQYKDQFNLKTIVDNKAWCYLNLKDYKNAITFLLESEKIGCTLADNLIFLPYCYYQEGDAYKARLQLARMQETKDLDPEGRDILRLFQLLFEPNIKEYLNVSKKLISRFREIGDRHLYEFFLNIEIDFLEENNMQNEAEARRKELLLSMTS